MFRFANFLRKFSHINAKALTKTYQIMQILSQIFVRDQRSRRKTYRTFSVCHETFQAQSKFQRVFKVRMRFIRRSTGEEDEPYCNFPSLILY